MINIFDFSTGISGRRPNMLVDKIHDPFAESGKQDTTKTVLDPMSNIEDKMVTNESRSLMPDKSAGSATKMLISWENSREMENWQKPQTVVAKLMGLDSIPVHKLPSIPLRVIPDCIVHNSCPKQQIIHHERSMSQGDRPFYGHPELRVYKDVYEVCQNPRPCQDQRCVLNFHHERSMSQGDCPFYSHPEHRVYKDVYEVCQKPKPCQGQRCDLNSIEAKMSLVRHKFREAKCLSKNQKLLHSKPFQDTLEVLTSNEDVFLNFLEQSNSFLSNCREIENPVPSPIQCNHITVLKPSKTCDATGKGKLLNYGHDFIHPKTESFPQKIKIVVLKPTPVKHHGKNHSPTTFFTTPLDNESLSDLGRDETGLSSSVLSNGYVGDDSSFNCSDNDDDDKYMEADCNSEFVTPMFQHSWNSNSMSRFSSPCSQCQPSSPEPSVTREAKKRLSERWVKVASNQMNLERRQQWRSRTSTLGEMLTVCGAENKEKNETSALSSSILSGREHEFHMPNNMEEDENDAKNSLNLRRSKSFPALAYNYKIEIDLEAPESQVGKSTFVRENMGKKLKSGKSTSKLKGKVSNFFSSMIRKCTQEKRASFEFKAGPIGEIQNQNAENQGQLQTFGELLKIKNFDPLSENDGDNQKEVISSIEQYLTCGEDDFSKSQEQYIPVQNTILDVPSRNISFQYSDSASIGCQRTISRSPPIGSIARSLSWDGDSCSGRTMLNTCQQSSSLLNADLEEEDRAFFVQSLLSTSGLGTEKSTFLARCHSLESPLNPALLDRFLEHKEGAQFRKKRSNQRLVFDCVNAALVDISRSHQENHTNSVIDEVLRRIKDCFGKEEILRLSYVSSNRFEVEMIVRKEVSGKWWSEMMSLENSELGLVIEGQVLEELLGEALDDLI